MKAFRFSLDRALHVRRAQLEIERARHKHFVRGREQLDVQTTTVLAETAAARNAITTQAQLLPGDISTMPDYLRGTRQRLLKLEQSKQELTRKMQDQQRLLLEAERKVKLLEKLRAKRFGEWECGMQRDQENFAADAYLARWTVSS